MTQDQTQAGPASKDPLCFRLVRAQDVTGVSGVGVVAVGVIFPDGQAVMQWQTQYSSIAIYKDLETLMQIHGHNGTTVVEVL